MPDLTGSDVGGNYRRALNNFSRFGTRRLALYTIWVYGLDDNTMNTLYDLENEYDPSFPTEWIEAPGSIIEAIQRGVQLVAEPYYYGDWDTNEEGPNYTDLYMTIVVAGDTVMDGYEQNNNSPVPPNQNSYTIESAIADAIAGFNNDGVLVQQAVLRGDYVDEWGSNALGRRNPVNTARQTALKAARVAAGKTGFKRNG
jgi:hypothetical protein